MMANEPMSDEQLETFHQTADDARRVNTFWSGQYAWTVARLLAEVERLRAREAALVAVVERVAEAGVGDDSSGGTWLMFSGYDAETVREQARALLAATEPTDATTAE